MKTDEANPIDWLNAGKERLRSADRLFDIEGSSPAVIELMQEGAERYLKAYLLSRNWTLVRTHDLNHLLAEATRRDPRFAYFAKVAQSLTEQFWEQHYPGGDLTEVGSDYDE
jgi:HEPN domain-containing protein